MAYSWDAGWDEDTWVTAYFEDGSGPATDLSPSIRIRRVDNGTAVASGTMTEMHDGWYKFLFEDYDITQDYYMLADSITLTNQYRYVEGASGEYGNILNNIYIMSNYIDCRTIIMRKIFTNRLELEDGDTQNWILYDDDNVTPLLIFSAQDKWNLPIYQTPRMTSKRSKAT